MSEDYERIEGTGQIPSTGFGPGLTHLNESGTASRNENNALVEPLKADKEAEQKNNNSNMVENNQNPVTEVSEQGAVQATVESVNNGMIPQGSATPDSNSSANQTDILNKESAKTMKKEDNHPLPTPLNIGQDHAVVRDLLKITGELSPENQEFCQNETMKISDLSPKHFAKVFNTFLLLDLLGAEEAGDIIIAKFLLNRIPKDKAVSELASAIKDVGCQIMCLVIPGTVAAKFGYTIVGFDGNPIPDELLYKVIVIVDGQTRFSGIRRIRREHPDKLAPRVYAYTPLQWVDLSKMLQAINLKVFSWSNSDFITGVLANDKVADDTKDALAYIQRLESEGYNYTAACEWVTLVPGIVRRNPLVKAMDSDEPTLKFDYSEFGIMIHKASIQKFKGSNSLALKSKTLPELVIAQWKKACKPLSQEDATLYIMDLIQSLTQNDVDEIASPSGYKRNCGKKKEDFVKMQFDKASKLFLQSNPYKTHKSKC